MSLNMTIYSLPYFGLYASPMYSTYYYSITFVQGGSCGVLASVQGFLLKALLFDPNITNDVDPLRPTRQEVRKALVDALTELLWKAGGCKQAALVR